MYSGTLIAYLFEAVKRAEKAAAGPFAPPPEAKPEALVGVGAEAQSDQKQNSEAE